MYISSRKRATSCQNAATKGPNNCSQFFTSSFSADISRQLDICTYSMLYFIYAVSRSYLSIRQISPGISVVFTNPWPVLARQGYMAGKNYLSSGKNYLLKISLAYLGLHESLAFTVLSRQGYMEGKAYLSSSKNYLLKISLAYLCLYESLDCII